MPSTPKKNPPRPDTTVTPAAPDVRSGPQDGGDVQGDLSLPHERDQRSHMTDGVPSQRVRQAAQDVARGLSDTSKGAEMDRTYQKQK